MNIRKGEFDETIEEAVASVTLINIDQRSGKSDKPPSVVQYAANKEELPVIAARLSSSEQYKIAVLAAENAPTVFRPYVTRDGRITYYHSRSHIAGFVPFNKG
jgi:hypothetical protein